MSPVCYPQTPASPVRAFFGSKQEKSHAQRQHQAPEAQESEEAQQMRMWLALCAACLAVYWLPVLIGPATGEWFFVANGSWSLALVAVCVLIGTRTALAVATLETAAIILNLTCLVQYVTGAGWLYGAYGEVIEAIVIAEIVVLAMGAPWHGLRRGFRELWGDPDYRGAAYRRRALDSEAS